MNKMTINTKKCKIMRIIRKTSPLAGGYNIEGLKTLYCSLVRPLLEYSCETWNPHTNRNSEEPPDG